ncbi:hypothetical protein B0T22DRAFT_483052 [Podospora appendiculata]|uniref:Uncharacterized protein n=1 Tax=Podospora appendiculata TaxID=314037 RepID=A0AAE1CB10_9PEZI|nr:hypothetical protein B0T22DRAFT_483052 [Podospora appendiculata]
MSESYEYDEDPYYYSDDNSSDASDEPCCANHDCPNHRCTEDCEKDVCYMSPCDSKHEDDDDHDPHTTRPAILRSMLSGVDGAKYFLSKDAVVAPIVIMRPSGLLMSICKEGDTPSMAGIRGPWTPESAERMRDQVDSLMVHCVRSPGQGDDTVLPSGEILPRIARESHEVLSDLMHAGCIALRVQVYGVGLWYTDPVVAKCLDPSNPNIHLVGEGPPVSGAALWNLVKSFGSILNHEEIKDVEGVEPAKNLWWIKFCTGGDGWEMLKMFRIALDNDEDSRMRWMGFSGNVCVPFLTDAQAEFVKKLPSVELMILEDISHFELSRRPGTFEPIHIPDVDSPRRTHLSLISVPRNIDNLNPMGQYNCHPSKGKGVWVVTIESSHQLDRFTHLTEDGRKVEVGHGTQLALLAAGAQSGVAPHANLLLIEINAGDATEP